MVLALVISTMPMNQLETTPAPAQADAADGLFPGYPTLDVGKLISLVLKRIWIAAAVFALFVALALVYVLTAPKIYRSTALISIESARLDGGVFVGMKGARTMNYESLDALKTIAAGLTGGSVILRVIEKLDLKDDPTFLGSAAKKKGKLSDADLVGMMDKRLESELIRGERNIYLSAEDTDPVRAQLIAETVISEFRAMIQEQNAKIADDTRQTLTEERESQAKRVEEAEAALQAFREKHPDMPLDESSGLLNQKYSDLQGLANRARDEANRLEAEYKQYLEFRDDPERILEIGTYSSQESIQKLLLARDEKIAEFHKIKQQFTPEHTHYKAYKANVEGLNEQVRKAALDLGESIENRYRSAVKRAESAEKAVRDQAEINLRAENIRRQFRALNRARDAALATYDRILERINDSSVTRNVDETMVRTFSPPLVNSNPVKPRKKIVVALAGFAGGAVGMGLVVLLGLLDRTLSTKRQMETTLGLTALAEIPLAFDPKQNWDLKESILVSKDPNSLVSEGFRALRTALSSLTPRSVMFTSAHSGEGKSFCAANLAVLQAQFGYRTLLVDADFRKPELNGIFVAPRLSDDEDQPGLVVQNSCQETTVPNLYLISVGQFASGGGEPLSGEHFAAMLWEAYSSFDCVIIDSSPLCLVSDGLNYSRYADSVVLVVRAEVTEAGPAQEAIRELRRMRAPLAGAVLNGVTRISEAKKKYVKRVHPLSALAPERVGAGT